MAVLACTQDVGAKFNCSHALPDTTSGFKLKIKQILVHDITHTVSVPLYQILSKSIHKFYE